MRNNYLVIMAGGIGSRFWPVSTPEKPKQFIDILGVGKTLIQSTVDRFVNICPKENIFIVTNEQYDSIIKEQLPFISDDQILLEPFMRNTAPCIAYAVNKIYKKNKNARIVVSPADHFIQDENSFQETIEKGIEVIKSNDVLVTLGITPSYPATGYGYIERENENELSGGMYKAKGFKEKPQLEIAERYVEQGNYLWNSGIFIWTAKSCINAFEEFLPKIQDAFQGLKNEYYSNNERNKIKPIYENCESISIDYGVMEKAENVFVIPSNFGWSDVGSWKALYDLAKKDDYENVLNENAKYIESEGNLLKVPKGKRVIIQGAKDFMIVDTGDTLLISKLDQDQRMKEFSKE